MLKNFILESVNFQKIIILHNIFIEYLKITDLFKNDDYANVSRKFNDKFGDF